MTVLLWILAFLGIALIYGAAKIVKLAKKTEENEKTENLVKLIGVLLSAAAMVLLWTTGSLK